MDILPECPVCGSTAAVRETTWVGAPMLVCDDCARGGRGAGAYFDPPKCAVCPDCKGTGIISHGYVADVGDCMTSCGCGA
jgi:hypothetical protein